MVWLPWRIKWGFSILFRRTFWKNYFNATSPMPPILAIIFLTRIFLQPTNTTSNGFSSSSIKIKGLGSIPINNFSDFYIFSEIFVDGCYDLNITSPKPVIVDIGANVGFFAFRMKQHYPKAKIWCFEPMPINFERLKRNIQNLNLSGINSYQVGVGDTKGDIPLFIHPSNTGGHTIVASQAAPRAEKRLIQVIPMRAVFDIVAQPWIDVLKLDCEGAEKQIILSLNIDHATRIGTIIYESTAQLYEPSLLTSHLESIGFECVWNGNLVVARH